MGTQSLGFVFVAPKNKTGAGGSKPVLTLLFYGSRPFRPPRPLHPLRDFLEGLNFSLIGLEFNKEKGD